MRFVWTVCTGRRHSSAVATAGRCAHGRAVQGERGEALVAKKSKKDTTNDADALAAALSAAGDAALRLPESDDAWDHLEELSERCDEPDRVFEVYRQALAGKIEPELRTRLGQRALRFTTAWFGEDPDKLHELLFPFIDGQPDSAWAFERLTRSLTLSERWSQLLDVYDHALARVDEAEQRRQWLKDAADVAKDFASQPERAIDYLRQRLLLEPGDAKLIASIERLLERAQRFADLVSLWRDQLSDMSGDGARKLQVRMAECLLDKLSDPAAAMAELRVLLHESPGHAEACALLARILHDEATAVPERLAAFELLRSHYDAAQRAADAIAAIEVAIPLSSEEARRALQRDAGRRLSVQRRDAEAMAHFAALLCADPTDTDARRELSRLAERSQLFEPLVEALVVAADATDDSGQRASLLSQAGEVRHVHLADAEGAVALFQRVLAEEGVSGRRGSAVAHDLAQLFEQTGQRAEQLATLERLCELETSASARRVVFTRAALLATELGEVDRALSAWHARIELDERDLSAWGAVIDLLESEKRSAELVVALRKRTACQVTPAARRADLLRMARVHIDELADLEAGIDVLLEAAGQFVLDDELLQALDRALSQAGRHAELSDWMARGLSDRHPQAARWLCRLGELALHELSQPERALTLFAEALDLAPELEGARAGLSALSEHAPLSARACEVLARAYRRTRDWEALVALGPLRIESAEDERSRARIAHELSEVHERELSRLDAALNAACAAFCHDPDRGDLEDDMLRLARTVGDFQAAAVAYGRAAEAATAGDEGARRDALSARLHLARAEVCARELSDLPGALTSLAAALHADDAAAQHTGTIGSTLARAALERIAQHATAIGDFAQAAGAIIELGARTGAIPDALLSALERKAGDGDAWEALCGAFCPPFYERAAALPAPLRSTLAKRVGVWCLRGADDVEAAEVAIGLAVRADAGDLETLELLCELRRRLESPRLIETLLQLDALDAGRAILIGARNLDHLYEAADTALTREPERCRQLLVALQQAAIGVWTSGFNITGEQAAPETARWATERLVALELADGQVESAAGRLLSLAALPVAPDVARTYRVRAAELLVAAGERERAVVVYQGVVAEAGDDLSLVTTLCGELEALGRVPELLSALRLRLRLTGDIDERLALRLRLSELVGEIERDDGRVAALRENLAEVAGHAESVQALWSLAVARGRKPELSHWMWQEAERLQAADQLVPAAALWERVADLCDELGDRSRAIDANRHAVELSESPERLSVLAALHLADGNPGEAARWLERRLVHERGDGRVRLLLQLAEVQLRAQSAAAAAEALEQAFEAAPRNPEVQRRLLQHYRDQQEPAGLARALSRTAEQVDDAALSVARATEAASIYRGVLSDHGAAVSALELAHKGVPEQREIAIQLADAYLAVERPADARSLMESLVAQFGRRRSPERAAVHWMLARALAAQGEVDGALDELDTAQSLDSTNVQAVRMLAELSHTAGQLERAERAYRALLLLVRGGRPEQEQADAGFMGPGAVLIELSFIAAELDQPTQAVERFESALEAIASSEVDAVWVQRRLTARGDRPGLERVLQVRLEAAEHAGRRAELLSEHAGVLADELAQPEAAFARILEAIDAHPAIPTYHDRAVSLSSALGRTSEYRERLQQSLADPLWSSQRHARCELLLRLGQLVEAEDAAAADAFYAQAEETGVRQPDVWRAQATCAGLRGDTERQLELLDRLRGSGAHSLDGETQADALYRMAEVQLGFEHSRAEGLLSLEQALDEAPQFERAGRILEAVCEEAGVDAALLSVYERVARAADDDGLRLSFLRRQAGLSDALPEDLREGAELAASLGDDSLAETLMLRAVELSSELPGGGERAQWALLGLVDRREAQGDLAGAVRFLLQAAEADEIDEVVERGVALGKAAIKAGGDKLLCAKLYEQLLTHAPTRRAIWEPLMGVYVALGDLEALEQLLDRTLAQLDATEDRCALRVAYAKGLMASETDLERASSVLQSVLDEAPQHREARELILEVTLQSGSPSEVAELLEDRLTQAQARDDVEEIRAASLRLGAHLRAAGQRDEAIEIYREAMSWLERDHALTQQLLETLGAEAEPKERAQLSERLMGTAEDDREALEHGLAAASLYVELEDGDAERRVLEAARARCPNDEGVLGRLDALYARTEDHQQRAELLEAWAACTDDVALCAARYREAAQLYRDQLLEPGRAGQALSMALEAAPDDLGIAHDVALSSALIGRFDEAVEVSTRALSQTGDSELRGAFLRVRAGAQIQLGALDEGLSDLEQALGELPTDAVAILTEALDNLRSVPGEGAVRDAERTVTLRLAAVQRDAGQLAEARERLSEWVGVAPDDREAIGLLLSLYTAENDNAGVLDAASRLVQLVEGDAQLQAAERLAEAAQALGEPGLAREGLEAAYEALGRPDALRSRLASVYESAGAYVELARVWLDQAALSEADDARAGAYRSAGQALLQAGDGERAVSAFENALLLSAEDLELQLLLVDAYIEAGQHDQANRVIDAALASTDAKRSTDMSQFCRRKAVMAERAGDPQTQLAWLQEGAKYDKKDGQLAVDITLVAESIEDWDTAEKTLRRLALLKDESPMPLSEVFVRQARILRIRGDERRALMWARRAHKEDPDSAQVAELLAELSAAAS